MNPAIDKTVEITALEHGGLNRIKNVVKLMKKTYTFYLTNAYPQIKPSTSCLLIFSHIAKKIENVG